MSKGNPQNCNLPTFFFGYATACHSPWGSGAKYPAPEVHMGWSTVDEHYMAGWIATNFVRNWSPRCSGQEQEMHPIQSHEENTGLYQMVVPKICLEKIQIQLQAAGKNPNSASNSSKSSPVLIACAESYRTCTSQELSWYLISAGLGHKLKKATA